MATVLFVHLSWTTWRRLPMIRAPEQQFLRRFLPATTIASGCEVVALRMVADHVHLLVRLPADFSIPKLVKQLKGASAHALNHGPTPSPTGLRWARGYDARSVSPGQVPDVVAYIRSQSERHPDRAIG